MPLCSLNRVTYRIRWFHIKGEGDFHCHANVGSNERNPYEAMNTIIISLPIFNTQCILNRHILNKLCNINCSLSLLQSERKYFFILLYHIIYIIWWNTYCFTTISCTDTNCFRVFLHHQGYVHHFFCVLKSWDYAVLFLTGWLYIGISE